jgi:hypothetical protein
MANITAKPLTEATVLTTSAVVMYTTPTATRTTIKKVMFTNTAAGTVTVSAYWVPNAGTPVAGNTQISLAPIATNGSLEGYSLENQTLAPGDTIQALCSAATSVNFAMSGVEVLIS